jgi:hypothetical protein
MWPGSGRTGLCTGSAKLHTLRHLCPDNPVLHDLAEETRLVVSEPLGDLAGAWNEVPESSYGIVASSCWVIERTRGGAAHPEMAGSMAAGWRISPDRLLYPVRAKF